MANILIVDDDDDIRNIIQFNFENIGHLTQTAASAEIATQILESQQFDILILDIMMSGMTGIELAQKLRKIGNHTPIIFLTALNAENDILRGFHAGGDDYISKPFSIKELIARTNAVLARTGHVETLKIGNIEIDVPNKRASLNGQQLTLTKTEFCILHTLAKKIGKIYSRTELIAKIWGGDVYVEERTVDVHIARLRKKLGPDGAMIINRSGYGYCLEC